MMANCIDVTDTGKEDDMDDFDHYLEGNLLA